MKKYTTGLLVFSLALHVAAQPAIETYVKQHTAAVHAIDPDSTDFSDLGPVGEAIGEARIVMLGEQDHGDAPTFLAKSRLIRYLHEKKGFDVLAFESDFYGLTFGWKPGLGRAAFDTLMRNRVYGLWSWCDACQALFYGYLPATQQTEHPLAVAGIDDQMYFAPVLTAVDSVVRALQLPIGAKANYGTEVRPAILNWDRNLKDSVFNRKYLGYLEEIRAELVAKGEDGWGQLITNLIAADIEFGNLKDYARSHNARDGVMASNLRWLAQKKYPGEKIIVWAHNFHISKYSGHYQEAFLNLENTMGTVFTSDSVLMRQTYIIGFTSYEGKTGRLYGESVYTLEKPRSNGFENWIAKDLDYAFVDFGGFNRSNPTASGDFYLAGGVISGPQQHKDIAAAWNRIFDGVFFIRRMYPCKKI